MLASRPLPCSPRQPPTVHPSIEDAHFSRWHRRCHRCSTVAPPHQGRAYGYRNHAVPCQGATIEATGATAVLVDAFDVAALERAVRMAGAVLVIHQLTDLPREPDPVMIASSRARNARLRIEGTRNLVSAVRAAAAMHRIIAQSLATAYAPGPEPHGEADPLDVAAEGDRAVSVQGVMALEHSVLATPGITGIVLRYGPGTWRDRPAERPSLHVDAAAHAALLAVTRGGGGAYNIADDDGAVSIAKARAELGFDPAFRL